MAQNYGSWILHSLWDILRGRTHWQDLIVHLWHKANKMWLCNTVPPVTTKSRQATVKVIRSLMSVTYIHIICGVCMANMKSLSLVVKSYSECWSWRQIHRTKTICPSQSILGHLYFWATSQKFGHIHKKIVLDIGEFCQFWRHVKHLLTYLV